MYLTGRIKTFGIIQLTWHTSEINFFRYIKVTSTQSATQIAVDSFYFFFISLQQNRFDFYI